jgi:Phage related hypothetical protein (DUF1799)
MVQALTKDPEAELFGVWEDNADVVIMFMKLQTQWVISNGLVVGLNYQSVEFLFTINHVAEPAKMMDDLQAMEAAALSILNKRKD